MVTERLMPPAAGLREEMAVYNCAALAWFEQHIRFSMERGNIASDTDTYTDGTAVVLLGAMRGVGFAGFQPGLGLN